MNIEKLEKAQKLQKEIDTLTEETMFLRTCVSIAEKNDPSVTNFSCTMQLQLYSQNKWLGQTHRWMDNSDLFVSFLTALLFKKEGELSLKKMLFEAL